MASSTDEQFTQAVQNERQQSPSSIRAAASRTRAVQQRSGLRRFLFENGLTLAALAFFVMSFAGQIVAGHRVYNDEQRDRGQPTAEPRRIPSQRRVRRGDGGKLGVRVPPDGPVRSADGVPPP